MGVTTTNCSCGWKTPPSWKFQGKSGNRQSYFFGKKYAHFISFLNSLQYRLERKNTSLVSFRLHKKNTSLVSFLEASFLQHRFCLYFELYAQKLHISFTLLFFIFPNNILAHLCQVSQNAPHFSPCNNLIILTVRV